MRFSALFSILLIFLSTFAHANWQKINDVDYTFGPFKIYNISLFTETGEYTSNIRPLMLTLTYDKPVDGRDFAISLARSWENLGIKVSNQSAIIAHLRKAFPKIAPKDNLSYIALADKGYFVLNDKVLSDEFLGEVNNAIVSVWLDPRVEIGKKITVKKKDQAGATETVVVPIAQSIETNGTEGSKIVESEKILEQAVQAGTQIEETAKTKVVSIEKLPESTSKSENSLDVKATTTDIQPSQAVETGQKSVNSPEDKVSEPASNEDLEKPLPTEIQEENPPPAIDAPIKPLSPRS